MPRTRLGEALQRIEGFGKQHRIRVANVFHAGDGNLHPLILYDARIEGEHERAEAVASDILHMCIAMGGSITGEHGVGLEKRAFMTDLFTPVDLAVMNELRRAADPGELANRGKKLPAGEPPALHASGPHPLEAAGVISRM